MLTAAFWAGRVCFARNFGGKTRTRKSRMKPTTVKPLRYQSRVWKKKKQEGICGKLWQWNGRQEISKGFMDFHEKMVRRTLRIRAKMQILPPANIQWKFRPKSLASDTFSYSLGTVLLNPPSQYWYTYSVLFLVPNIPIQESYSKGVIGSWCCRRTEIAKIQNFSKSAN